MTLATNTKAPAKPANTELGFDAAYVASVKRRAAIMDKIRTKDQPAKG